MLEMVLSIISAVAGITALLTLVWALAFRLSALNTKVDLMWKVVVEDALIRAQERGILQHESNYVVSGEWLREWADTLDRDAIAVFTRVAARTHGKPTREIALTILRELGEATVAHGARRHGLSASGYLCTTALIVEDIQLHGSPF